MAAAVDSPGSSPLGSESQPAQNGNIFSAESYPFPSFLPTVPVGPAGAAQHQASAPSFQGTGTGMTPGKPAVQTPRKAHRTSKVRSPIPSQPASNSSAFGSEEKAHFLGRGTSWPHISADSTQTAAETADTSLPQQFAQSVNLGANDWPPSARKPPPATGAFSHGTPKATPITARRGAHRVRRPPATAGRTPTAVDSPFIREGSPMDWSPFVATAACGQTSTAAQTPVGNMSNARDDEVIGTRLKFERRADEAAAEHTSAAPPEAGEDVTDGLHVDLAASSLSGNAAGSTQPSLASDFSTRFRFGEAPRKASSAGSKAAGQPPQQEAAADAPDARPSADSAAGTAGATRSASSDSSSSGVANANGIGVRPSGSSRFGNGAADRDLGRRVTKTETVPGRSHGDARSGRADVSTDISASSAAAPLHRSGVPENDRARANEGFLKPAAFVKPVKVPAERTVQVSVHQREDAARRASAGIQDADMPDASPCASSQARADSNGSTADSTAPFGSTETALPAGVKSRATGAVKSSRPAVPDAAAAQPTMNGWSWQSGPAKAEAAAGSAGGEEPASAGLTFSFEAQKRAASGFSSSAASQGAPGTSANAAEGSREVRERSAAAAIPQPSGAKGFSGSEGRAQEQAQAGSSQQGTQKPALGTEGFTLGSFSRMHNRKGRAGAAVRSRGAAAAAQQTHAAKADQRQAQKSPGVPGNATSAASDDVSNMWRSYAAQLHGEKVNEAGKTGGTASAGQTPDGNQSPASFGGSAEQPHRPAAGTGQPPAQASAPQDASKAAFADAMLKSLWGDLEEKRQNARQEDSSASQSRRQNFSEADGASMVDSAAAAGAGKPPAAAPAAVPEKGSFSVAPLEASFGAGQQGASFGFRQAPNAQRATPRRGRPTTTAPASSAFQPPSGPKPAAQEPSVSFAQPSTSDQPSRNPGEAFNSATQQSGPHTLQQPIFGFQPAQDASAAQQASQPAFGWSAPQAPTAAASSAGVPEQMQPPPFSFKSPGSKGLAPSDPRWAQSRVNFDWLQPGGVPSAQPAASMPMTQPEACSGAFAAEKPACSEEARPARGSGRAPSFVVKAGRRVAVTTSKRSPTASQGTGSQAGSEAGAERQKASPLEDVDRLRQRGNDAFQRGSYSRSADLYQRAVNLLRENGVAEGLGKLYSNLAAAFLQMDKPYAAIAACNSALQEEPAFFRARLRMATSHSRLGDLPAALGALGLDATSAANLAEAAGKRADLEALQERCNKVTATASAASSTDAAESALRELEALLAKDMAPFSPTLHRLRAQLLLQLGRREEAAEMCRLCAHVREPGLQPPPLWPRWLSAQCAFHAGDLNLAAEQIEALTARYTAEGKDSVPISENDSGALPVADLAALSQQLRSLLKLKEAGNRAIKDGKGQEALQHYNAALTAEVPGSAEFVAVLFANRAAAHQALGQATHAVADCLRATALNPAYSKARALILAHSRLAAVLSELKHRTGEADALERLQALPVSSPAEAAGIAQRLRAARAAARTATPDHYKVLGIARDADAEEVRRAYKRSALALHPDKALAQCRFSSRLGAHGTLLADTAQVQARVRDNADWLFKCVGAAHAALTDPAARRQLDADLAAQEGRASGYGYTPYSPSSSYHYSSTSDFFPRRPGGRKSSSNYGGAPYYESYQRRGPRRPAGGYGAANGHGGAASDDSDTEGFDYKNFY